jgi:hypothetical protein
VRAIKVMDRRILFFSPRLFKYVRLKEGDSHARFTGRFD